MLIIARAIGDTLLAPFVWLPPLWAVAALSVACGLLFLLAFRLVSPQRRLRRVKELMSSTIYEMRIFASQPRRVLSAQGRALRLTLLYLLLALPALLLLFPPLALLLTRAATWYEYRALHTGEVALLTVSIERPVARDRVVVEPVGDGVAVQPPVVLVRSRGRAYARVRALRRGEHSIRVALGGRAVEKTVRVGRSGPVSLHRERAGSLAALLSHEAPLPDAGPVRFIALDYPRSPERWLALPWYLLLLVISLAVALAFRRRLGVVF